MLGNRIRNMNFDMYLGASDGTFKSVSPDRGGLVEAQTGAGKSGLPWYYGVAQTSDRTVVPRFAKQNTSGTTRVRS